MAIPSSSKEKKILDGPKTSAFIQTIKSFFYPFKSLKINYRKYGDIFSAKGIGDPPLVILSNPQAIEQVFTRDQNLFEVGKGNLAAKPLLGENSLVLLDGKKHQKNRQLLMPPFHGERMKSYGQLICQIAEKVISDWEIDKPFIIRDYTQKISLRVIVQAVFGVNKGKKYEELIKLIADWLNIFNSPLKSAFFAFPWLQKNLGFLTLWAQFLQQKQRIRTILAEEINEKRNNPELLGEDILSLMISVKDEDGEPMGDEEIKDQLMTILFGGHESTASSLAWAFYWIHFCPEVKKKLMEELNAIEDFKDTNAITKLPYLSAVVAESLRITPVNLFTFARQLKEPLEILGYKFDPGTMLVPCIYLTHYREDIYPEPHKFKPERFIEKQFSPYEYFPFGGGNRRCLGSAFALFEMKLVLATVLSKVELQLLEKRPVKSSRRGMTFTPYGGVKMSLVRIRNGVLS
ncbi:MAG: cytochrome P450 [Prochloraceae cyanobacterium]|nr:cytochrome P450 [Prochloraceae cyanobacterium]